jgi:hypothetical protein
VADIERLTIHEANLHEWEILGGIRASIADEPTELPHEETGAEGTGEIRFHERRCGLRPFDLTAGACLGFWHGASLYWSIAWPFAINTADTAVLMALRDAVHIHRGDG